MVGQLGNRVLLVDDEPLIRKVISGCLVAAGYVVQTAADGLDALGKLRAGLPDLIISDFNMPRMSGLEFLAVVRTRFPQIPVIVISSETADEMPAGLAADAYYHKNGDGFQLLLETISDLTRKPPLRTAPPVNDNGPAQALRDLDGNSIIRCEDCLREFVIPPVPKLVRYENWTSCSHCGKLVQFLDAEHSEVANSRPLRPPPPQY
jgi:CheY-like chemotaxis protein